MNHFVRQASVLVLLFISFITPAQERITAQDYQRAEKMLGYNTAPFVDRMKVDPHWLPDGRFWYSVLVPDGKEYVLINPKDGARKTAHELTQLLPGQKEVKPLKERHTGSLSPDGKKEVFIKDWNLWLRNLETKEEIQLTTDGIENFGYATDNAGWRKSEKAIALWSPDSKKVATYQQDQRHVSNMYLVTTNVGEPKLEAWKYPLPKDPQVIMIHRVIIDTEAKRVIRLKVEPDPRRGTLCDDISCSGAFDDNYWSEDGKTLAFVSTSRDHKIARLRVANAASGDVTEIFQETVETQYESGQGEINWKYLSSSNEFIWYSERDDWGHLYLYDQHGKLKHQITKGNFVVTQLLYIDEKNRLLYFMANGRESGRDPYFSHFYSIDFEGKSIKLLTPENANHEIKISPDHTYFVDAYSTIDAPPVTVMRNMKGNKIADLEKSDISRLVKNGWKAPMPIKVKSRDGKWDLYGIMYTPTNLDQTKKYPIVNYIYPGPQGGSVGTRSFMASRLDHQALAELGFIVVQIDGTCNPDRSKSFHDACYGNLGDCTLEDQIAGMKQLAAAYPYIDLNRVGIWGHSGGGFATAAAMFRYPEFFKVGISESGNHDNRNYEDDWAERYIGLIKNYETGSSNYEGQANQYYAKNLKGKLLLAHGNMDDNVPPYNTYLLVDALVEANKDFDLIVFPNARHGFGKDTYYMMRRRWDYFVRYLTGTEPPKEYELKVKVDMRNK